MAETYEAVERERNSFRAENATLKVDMANLEVNHAQANSFIDKLKEEVLELKTEVERLKESKEEREEVREVTEQLRLQLLKDGLLKPERLDEELLVNTINEKLDLQSQLDKSNKEIILQVQSKELLEEQLDKANEENNKLISKGLELKIENITANKRIAEYESHAKTVEYESGELYQAYMGSDNKHIEYQWGELKGSIEALRALEVGDEKI